MNVFEAVKQNVTTRQAAEVYGIPVSRNGMAVCPCPLPAKIDRKKVKKTE